MWYAYMTVSATQCDTALRSVATRYHLHSWILFNMSLKIMWYVHMTVRIYCTTQHS